ncbi:MAG: hypothetical protein R3F61_27040 [Myxococcota bacterium]
MYSSILLVSGIAACGPRTASVVESGARQETEVILERFRSYRLEPAGIAPPTLGTPSALTSRDSVTGSVELVRAEDAEWNQWPGSTSRLFNNRMAYLFQVEITSSEPVRWLPERTRLELNEEGNVFHAAPSQEVLLEDLLFWAYHQERSVLDGDLALRARAAGPLREAYLQTAPDTLLSGLVAFPLVTTPDNEKYYRHVDPADYHVVSMRLTLALQTATGVEQLVWMLE